MIPPRFIPEDCKWVSCDCAAKPCHHVGGGWIVRDENATTLAEQLERLTAWKESAMTVLAEWDRVHEALGSPGLLGASKALSALTEVNRLRSGIEALGIAWIDVGGTASIGLMSADRTREVDA